MPKVTFVKKARKANKAAGIKKGDSYYWWKFMVGGRGGPKICSKTKPKRSQLTRSEFLSTMYDLEDQCNMISSEDIDEVVGELEEIKGEVENQGEECRNKYDNMPEGLQQGDTGQLLEERAQACEDIASSIDSAISDIQNIDTEDKDKDVIEEISNALRNIDWCLP